MLVYAELIISNAFCSMKGLMPSGPAADRGSNSAKDLFIRSGEMMQSRSLFEEVIVLTSSL